MEAHKEESIYNFPKLSEFVKFTVGRATFFSMEQTATVTVLHTYVGFLEHLDIKKLCHLWNFGDMVIRYLYLGVYDTVTGIIL